MHVIFRVLIVLLHLPMLAATLLQLSIGFCLTCGACPVTNSSIVNRGRRRYYVGVISHMDCGTIRTLC